jgi:hypothetical protein
MGVDLRMEPYAEMFQKERPEWRIFDELLANRPNVHDLTHS